MSQLFKAAQRGLERNTSIQGKPEYFLEKKKFH